MKKLLKHIVVILGILIFILLSIIILTIFNKYKNSDNNYINYIKLKPKVEDNFSLKGFQINKNEIQLFLENNTNNKIYIRLYDKKNGNLLSEIEVK